MTEDSGAFGARLSASRRNAGLSQADLAERSGLSIRAISDLERGRTRWPHPDTVQRLADALDLPAGERPDFAAAAGRRLSGASADPLATAPGEHAGGMGGEHPVPRQLPGPVRQFAGRQDELTALTGLLDQAGAGDPAAVVISALGGMAGVGKTALAVHWAHQVAGQFPDGQLYVNLRGYDMLQPMPASDALAGFLRALGMAGRDIPDGIDERSAAYRSMLAGRRLLVLLDNARDVAHVRPLLPGSSGCVTVVTSRDSLGGLVAGDGAVRLRLDLLPLAEAVGLLQALIGSRVAEDPAAAVELADQCGRLPLALRVAAERVVSRSGAPLADLTTELTDLRRRLDMLETGGDERTTVRSVFTWSYQDLDPVAARIFRLVGLHPGPDLSVRAAASLAGLRTGQAQPAPGELTRAHLLNEQTAGRFSCHDLLRAFAAELAFAHDSPAQRHMAMQRVLDHYVHSAYAADRVLHPARDPLALPPAALGTVPEEPAGPDEAIAWCEAEYKVVRAAISYAAGGGFDRHAWQLARSYATFLDLRGLHEDLVNTQRIALAAAISLKDEPAQAQVRDKLGFACLLRGQYTEAASHFEQALEQFRQLDDPAGAGCVHLNLSFLLERQEDLDAAVEHDELALRLFQAAGHAPGQARSLNAAGWHLALLGRYEQALTSCQQALALQRDGEDRLDEANTWDSVGYIHDKLGQFEQAAHCYSEALRLLAGREESWRQATVLSHLGDTYHHAGDQPAARDAWRQALAILDDMRHADADAVRARLTHGT